MPCASPGRKAQKPEPSAISAISAVKDFGSGFRSSDRDHGVCQAMYPIGGPEMGQEVPAPSSTGHSSSGRTPKLSRGPARRGRRLERLLGLILRHAVK